MDDAFLKPYDGLLIVSLEQAVAAPLASCHFAQGGARVIKIERENEGDFARKYDRAVKGTASYFAWANHGKESLCLDIKTPSDAALLDRLLAKADIFIQNLAPGAIERAGFGSKSLRRKFPRLITCDISGYGEAGTYRDMKAYDFLVQCESGLVAVNGAPGHPGRIGVSVCDIGASMNAIIGLQKALIARGITGNGSAVKLSLFDTAADWMTVPLTGMSRLGIIGATGWLGQALGLNLLHCELWDPEELVLLRRSGDGASYRDFPKVRWAKNAQEIFDLCETVVLTVRPNDFPVPGFAPRDHLLISFMAGWSLRQLQDLAPQARIVRAMPNGGATVGQSYTPWISGTDVTAAEHERARLILSAVGAEDQLETEDQLHYLSALSGSGGAYPGLMAKAMLEHARTFGLPDRIADRAVEAVITGSVGLLTGKITQVDDLLASYMSYKGITAAGLDAARAAGFEQALHKALSAAFAKARAMGAD